jgi:hypothetical protein
MDAAGARGTILLRNAVDPADRYINYLTGLTEDELLALINSTQHTDPNVLTSPDDDIDIIGLQADENWRMIIVGLL